MVDKDGEEQTETEEDEIQHGFLAEFPETSVSTWKWEQILIGLMTELWNMS